MEKTTLFRQSVDVAARILAVFAVDFQISEGIMRFFLIAAAASITAPLLVAPAQAQNCKTPECVVSTGEGKETKYCDFNKEGEQAYADYYEDGKFTGKSEKIMCGFVPTECKPAQASVCDGDVTEPDQ